MPVISIRLVFRASGYCLESPYRPGERRKEEKKRSREEEKNNEEEEEEENKDVHYKVVLKLRRKRSHYPRTVSQLGVA